MLTTRLAITALSQPPEMFFGLASKKLRPKTAPTLGGYIFSIYLPSGRAKLRFSIEAIYKYLLTPNSTSNLSQCRKQASSPHSANSL